MNKIIAILYLIFFFQPTGGIGQDTEPPVPPVIKAVSVDTSNGLGKVTIEWYPSISTDTWGYVTYKNTSTASNPIWDRFGDTLASPFITVSIDSSGDSNYEPQSYRVIAIDSSRNNSLMSNIHTTIRAFPYLHLEDCPPRILVSWNGYKGWGSGVAKYRIYIKTGSSNFQLADSVIGTQTTYEYLSIADSTRYCFIIEAVHSGGTLSSTSNICCVVTEMPQDASSVNANFATISGYDEISISFSCDTIKSLVEKYKLIRKKQGSVGFDTIANFSPDQAIITFTEQIDASKEIRHYQLIGYSKCDSVLFVSNAANNILLRLTKPDDLHFQLCWTKYDDWNGGVESYDVYRVTDRRGPELISSQLTSDTSYMDDIFPFLEAPVEGDFCYFIEAKEGANPYFTGAVSRSNIVCGSAVPIFFIPNAFRPLSPLEENQTFKPKISFASPENYQMVIFDRWGQKCFESTSADVGWNGKKDEGTYSETETYVYYISFSTAKNEVYEDAGTFMMVVP